MIIPLYPEGGHRDKVTTTIATPQSNVQTALDEAEIADLRLNGGWLSLQKFATLSGLHERTLQRSCKRKKYADLQRIDTKDRRRPYQLHISVLPDQLRDVVVSQVKDDRLYTEEDRRQKTEAFLERSETPAYNVRKAYVRNTILTCYREFLSGAGHGELLTRKHEFVDRFNRGWITDLLEERDAVGSVSWKTLDSWQKLLDAAEGDVWGLAPKYGSSLGKHSVSEVEAGVLLKYAMNPNGLPYAMIIAEARRELQRIGYPMRLSDATYRRWLRRHAMENGYLHDLVRQGEKALNDRYLPHVRRDLDRIEVGDILVADGHTLNFTMIDPLTGRPKRMTLVVVFDFKSSMPVGWEFSATENTAAIASAYRRAIRRLGFVPREFYTDNGRAFKASFFSKRPDVVRNVLGERAFSGLFDRLKPFGFVAHRHALPYHGQSKPVERFFGSMEQFSRRMPTYLGNSIEHRVASERRNEKFARELRERWCGGAQPDIRSVHAMLVAWFAEYAERPMSKGAFYAGRKPIEVFAESLERVRAAPGFVNRVIGDAELSFLMMAEVSRSIRNGKVRLFGREFYADELVGFRPGEKTVVVRYDLFDEELDGKVLVYDERGVSFICVAVDGVMSGLHPSARLLGSQEDVERLDGALGVQRMVRGESMRMARMVTAEGFFDAMRAEELRSVPTMREVEIRKRTQSGMKTGTDGGRLCREERDALNERLLLLRAGRAGEEEV
jgi:putative transposase